MPHTWLTDRLGRVSAEAIVLDLAAWNRAWRDLSDGLVPESDVHDLCLRIGYRRRDRRDRLVSELVREGCWRPVAAGGFELVGWMTWNPSREEMKARREQYRRRTATARRRRAERQAMEREAQL